MQRLGTPAKKVIKKKQQLMVVFDIGQYMKDVSISQMDRTKSIIDKIIVRGTGGSFGNTGSDQLFIDAYFLNDTTVRLSRSVYNSCQATVNFECTEFSGVKAKQNVNVASATATVSAVDFLKTLCAVNGTTTYNGQTGVPIGYMQNSTQVNFYNATAYRCELLEFK